MKKILISLPLFLASCVASNFGGVSTSKQGELVRIKPGMANTDTLYLISDERDDLTFCYHNFYGHIKRKFTVGEWYEIKTRGCNLKATIKIKK